MFDTHCHLTAPQFDADRDEVIRRALDAGVTGIITLGTDVASSRAAIELAERYPAIYAAVGIHPEAVTAATVRDIEVILHLAAHPRVVAIGEIGLDYYWEPGTAELQQVFFERQLALAAELDLPVAVHDREAHLAIIETLERVCSESKGQSVRGVLHAFSGDLAMAQAAFELGFVVSLGGPITFANNRHAPELVQALPLDKLLLETDSPYLAPHPLRGKRNEPSNVIKVAARIAELKGITIDDVAAQTTANCTSIFTRLTVAA
jgi:TatD DNase family protein